MPPLPSTLTTKQKRTVKLTQLYLLVKQVCSEGKDRCHFSGFECRYGGSDLTVILNAPA